MKVDRAAKAGFWADYDWWMTGLMLAIALLGLLQIYSATHNSDYAASFPQQCTWLAVGLVAYVALSTAEYRDLVALSPWMWAVIVLLLVCVLAFAEPINGARRWLVLPIGTSVQVSEMAKVVLLLVVARYCGGFVAGTLRARDVVLVAPLFFAVFLLVVLQPDLSTALSLLPLLAMVLFLSRIPKRYFAVFGLLLAVLAPLAWSSLKPYQKDRIAAFWGSSEAPLSSGYQILQAKVAVGAGGLWGQGLGQGSQTQLRFLPAAHTDFVLASFAEEQGFAGVALVVLLYMGLLWRITDTARKAREPEGVLVAMGVAALLLFHLLVNGGMVANLLPVTGLPLPLMSYGGSNLLAAMAMLGLVNSVRIRRFVN